MQTNISNPKHITQSLIFSSFVFLCVDCIHSFLGWRCRQGKQHRTTKKTKTKKQASACITHAFPSPPPSNHSTTPGTRTFTLILFFRFGVAAVIALTPREGGRYPFQSTFPPLWSKASTTTSRSRCGYRLAQFLWEPIYPPTPTHPMGLLSHPSLPSHLLLLPLRPFFQSILSFCLHRNWHFFLCFGYPLLFLSSPRVAKGRLTGLLWISSLLCGTVVQEGFDKSNTTRTRRAIFRAILTFGLYKRGVRMNKEDRDSFSKAQRDG